MNPHWLRRILPAPICLLMASAIAASPGSWPFDSNDGSLAGEPRTAGECPPECVDGCIDFSLLRSGGNAKVLGAWQTLTSDIVNAPNMTADPGDYLGTSVMAIGDHMVAVAALENFGNLYFYRRIAGQWVFQSRRAASQDGTGAGIRPFLYDHSGNRMILGGAGGQFIIVRLDGDEWRTEAIADGVIESQSARMGVAIDGDRAVVTYVGLSKIKVLAFDGTRWQLESEWSLPDLNWAQTAVLSADLQGGRLVIGDPMKTVGSTSHVGRALVYGQAGGAWTLEATLSHSEEEADLQFGHSVSVDGDLVAVGAWGDDVGSRANAGSASVFRKVDGQWMRVHTLTPDATVAHDGFGWRTMLVGDRLYVSQYGLAPGVLDGGLFEYDLSTPTPTILNHLVEPGFTDRLGTGFVVVGSELFAGTPGRSGRGGIKAFTRAGNGWVLAQVIEQDWSLPRLAFGAAVATDGTHLMVRESNRPVPGGASEPVVHAYELQDNQWQRVQILRAPVAEANAGFGADVALRGDVALISRVRDYPRIVELHAYRFAQGQWQRADSIDLASLATSFSHVSGVRIRFLDGGVVLGLEGFSDQDSVYQHEIRAFDLGADGRFGGWDTLSPPNAQAWRGASQLIAADGDWVAVHDSYGVVTETQVRGVTSVFRRTPSGWTRQWDLPSEVAQPIGACGIGATQISGGVALVGDRLFVAVGGGETQGGAIRGASIDTYSLDPSRPPLRLDTRPSDSLQLRSGHGRLALFDQGALTFFDPSRPLSAQSPEAIVPPRTYYAPILDFGATHVAFGVPWMGDSDPAYMGEVHVLGLGLGFGQAAVPLFGPRALIVLAIAMLAFAAMRLAAQRGAARR